MNKKRRRKMRASQRQMKLRLKGQLNLLKKSLTSMHLRKWQFRPSKVLRLMKSLRESKSIIIMRRRKTMKMSLWRKWIQELLKLFTEV